MLEILASERIQINSTILEQPRKKKVHTNELIERTDRNMVRVHPKADVAMVENRERIAKESIRW